MKHKILLAIAAVMVTGGMIFISCNKENDVTNLTADNGGMGITSKDDFVGGETAPDNNLITILEVKQGKKISVNDKKTCSLNKGTCWLWFGGAFLTKEVTLEEGFPTRLYDNPDAYKFVDEHKAGIFATVSDDNSLDLVYDFSCVEGLEEKEFWLSEIRDSTAYINDTIILNDNELLYHWGFSNSIAIPYGAYRIIASDSEACQYYTRVPYFVID